MSRLRAIPAAGASCSLVALLVLVCFALLTPPWHVPDEIAHFAYVQQLAETGKPPVVRSSTVFSPEEQGSLDALHFNAVIGQATSHPVASAREQAAFRAALARPASRRGNGDASIATSQPPLYYAAQAVVYKVAGSGSLYTRLTLMRLLSCLFGALTVLFVWLFLREAIPRRPWAWTVGALGVAFQPMFAFISSGVNPDALLFTAGAALFFGLARGFRRGLTLPLAGFIGATVALGALTKLNFLGLAPAAALGVLGLALRRPRADGIKAVLVAGAIVAAPVALYALLNVAVWDRPASGSAALGALASTGGVSSSTQPKSLSGLVSYLWQFYLPKLPFMTDDFSYWPLRSTWLNGFVGRFGWLDYSFTGWVYDAAPFAALAVALGVVVELVRRAGAIARRKLETVVYLVAIAGLLYVIGRAGYQAKIAAQPSFEQARYLLPLLPLYGFALALAARAAGRRFGPAVGAAIVSVAAIHTVAAMLITLTRYYG